MYKALADAIRDAESQGTTLAAVALAAESRDQGRPVSEIRQALARALAVMRSAVTQGLTGDLRSASGLVGGDAAKLREGPPGPLAGTPFRDILARALAVQEVNAAMGVIVAAPTAGGAGVLPAVLLGLADAKGLGDELLIDALATAGLIGAIVAERASLSGAEGGCQAETGAAAGMAAGAATEMLGGSPSQAGHAVALAQQGTLGLVCDPLGGLVELPCVFRNATGAAIALAAIEMAMAGITFAIPADEVIDTMGEIGRSMDVRYRETAGGGLAATPTGRRLARERLVQIKRSDA
ncbi:MAG TPA: L-serine ammonia-lyase, iron-sulfur-dependent, subunit alpha [Gemmatimonadaceae bacterium]|jgi:L-serine dehydratase|nr:L-serine ammonia-lyase, iron-sulfur-dependent, subunit alpha [Gemmatimonadota bacterium]MBK8646658.1 L-serine ammonia-lyase, iron-sulfur-dependent, subunit alpha [Gemmatimonadota bacterium]MBK9977854.1 L-serine ammonia-lyase, iron-sulfur-dependent, subunit alpha [Gemmatimonadota bacterium]HNV74479.1 L-serine ammonia-lyase, iron-sulfur-dependent, subunit alpha [Gemmatimonadaceae bacterium]HPV73692.1 L-serine ammonia-lyase, iron-sulfur-dependent, subunit alpha [Gemmatimonadaceae bacterium]